MRIKTFTLMTLALLVSAVSFAQKPAQDRQSLAFDRQAVAQQSSHQRGNAASDGLAMYAKNMPAKSAATRNVAPRRAPETVTPPADSEVEYFKLQGTVTVGQGDPTNSERTVKVIWDGDDVYISGLSWYVEDAYVKGTFTDDETVVFPMGQYLGNPGVDLYFAAYSDNGPIDAVAAYDGEANKFTFKNILLDNQDPANGLGFYAYWMSGLTVTKIEGEIDLPVEIPTDIELADYSYSAFDYFEDDAPVSKIVKVGFYGNEVYIQGLSFDLPDAWVKGTLEGDYLTIPAGQLLGRYRNAYDLWFVGYAGTATPADYVLKYDAATNTFTETDQYLAINIYKDVFNRSLFQLHYDVTIKKIEEKAGTPAASSVNNIYYLTDGNQLLFNLAVVDTEGNGLVTSKLSYKLYSEDAAGNQKEITFTKDLYVRLDEELTEVPATFTDNYDFYSEDGIVYLNMDLDNWAKIGLKTIYRGGGEEHESEIAWYTITHPQTITLPEGAVVTKNELDGYTYNSEGNEEYATEVNVAVVDNDIYIQGLSVNFPDAWIKGTKNAEGNYVFANGQELGTNRSWRIFLIGYADDVTDAVLSVDLLSGVYRFETEFVINAGYTDRLYYMGRILDGTTIKIDGESTGIKTVKTANANGAAVYNLAGQRVSDGFKGLVIKNGKKFVNK